MTPRGPIVSLQIRSPPNNSASPSLPNATLLTPFILFPLCAELVRSLGGPSHSSTRTLPTNSPLLAPHTSTPSSVPSQMLPWMGSVAMPPLGATFGEYANKRRLIRNLPLERYDDENAVAGGCGAGLLVGPRDGEFPPNDSS